MSPNVGVADAEATSVDLTVMEAVEADACVPLVSLTRRVAMYVPAALYVCDGLWLDELPPSPKVHAKV
jgi:hypothetical protein